MTCVVLSLRHPQGLKNLLNKNSYILHIDRAVLIKLSFFIILENCCFFQYGSQKKCRGRDNSQIGQGGAWGEKV